MRKKCKKNKHETLIDKVYNAIKPKGCIDVFIGIEYGPHSKLLGEVDVWEIYPTYEVYYEAKSRHSDKQYNKAIHQTLRWTEYMKKHEPHKNYYGVYYTPELVKILCKNGELRK